MTRYTDHSHRTIFDDCDPRDFGGDIADDASYPDDAHYTAEPWPPRSGTLHTGRTHTCRACGDAIKPEDVRWSDSLRARVHATCLALATLRKEGLL